MKLYLHKIGPYSIRSQIEDPEKLKKIWDEFVPTVLYHGFKLKSFDPKTTPLPEILGLGFHFENETLTAWGKDFELMILDNNGVKIMARHIPEGQEH